MKGEMKEKRAKVPQQKTGGGRRENPHKQKKRRLFDYKGRSFLSKKGVRWRGGN